MSLSIARPELGLSPVRVRGLESRNRSLGCAGHVEPDTWVPRVEYPGESAPEETEGVLSGRLLGARAMSPIRIARPSRPRKVVSRMSGDVETLRQNGAVVNVLISAPSSSASAARQQGQEVPKGRVVKALVDTGASISTVEDATAADVGLVQTGSIPLGGVGGSSERPVYAARIEIQGTEFSFDPIEMAGVQIPYSGVQMLIGRDMLQKIRLDYVGPQGEFALTDSSEVPPGAEQGQATSGAAAVPTAIALLVVAGAIGALLGFDVI